MKLPLVLHLFGKTQQIPNLKDRAVIQGDGTVEPTENLILITLEEFEIGVGGAVHNGGEVHLKASVIAGEFPGGQEIVLAVFGGDMEGNLGQLMCFAPVEEHIFAGGGGVAEAVANVEAEIHAACQTGCATPVPGVMIGPNTPTPVQNAEAVLGRESVAVGADGHGAVGPHAVDLLIVVEVSFLFEGR